MSTAGQEEDMSSEVVMTEGWWVANEIQRHVTITGKITNQWRKTMSAERLTILKFYKDMQRVKSNMSGCVL